MVFRLFWNPAPAVSDRRGVFIYPSESSGESKMTAEKGSSGSVGVVKTQTFSFEGLELESGRRLAAVDLAFETYGRLNADRSNGVLVCHALSGDAHAAGFHEGEKKPGWWDDMVGPGKAFDTDKYFVICANVLGGCRGSTGPSSVNPATGLPFGTDFPFVTVGDMVRAQTKLLDHLKIETLLCVSGGSMGGMQALQWAAAYPDRVKSVIPLATTLKHSPQQIAFGEVGRQAVMADPAWRGGNYYAHGQPERGLALARMIGHITYMSDVSMEEKFSRRTRSGQTGFSFNPEFEVEGYLRNRGDHFVQRFDANAYLYLTRALDYFDLSGDRLLPAGGKAPPKFLVIAFKSDWLYPAYQSKEIVNVLRGRQADVTYCEIQSTYGHDAFLLEFEQETTLIKHFLARVSGENVHD